MGFFDKLKQGLAKTKQVFSFTKVDEKLMDELEEKLIIADVGMETTERMWILYVQFVAAVRFRLL